jgi:hypothetical protein
MTSTHVTSSRREVREVGAQAARLGQEGHHGDDLAEAEEAQHRARGHRALA